MRRRQPVALRASFAFSYMTSLNFLVAASLVTILVILILLWITNRQLNDKYLREVQRAAKLEAELQAEKRNLEENKERMESARLELAKEFEVTASRILDKKSEKFSKQNKEAVEQLMNPFKEQLDRFDRRIVTSRTEDAKERQQVRDELKQIRDLGLALSLNADNLTKALKGDSKTQGNWGEMVLEKILENSGLKKDLHYLVQKTQKTTEGKTVQPDILITLPDNKVIVVDSKVSLIDYEKSINSETTEEEKIFRQKHVNSIENHIKGLAKKNYQNLISHQTLDFVLIFIAIDEALLRALKDSPNLFDLAMTHNIGLVSPSLLMPSLRTIENLWRIENQNRNAEQIAREAGQLYDKFVNFFKVFSQVGERLEQAQTSFEDAKNKLEGGRGNMISRAEKLKTLGAKTSKSFQNKSDTPKSKDALN
tara:strand:+ start:247 stop:1518 length:1272 start_codon:yes stop_codon:yes gene_type:complete